MKAIFPALTGLVVVALSGHVTQAAEPSLLAPTPAVNWSGFYAGVQAGYVRSTIQPSAFDEQLDLLYASHSCSGAFCDGRREAALGGITLGWNTQYADRTLLGIEADIAYSGLDGDFDFAGTTDLSPVERIRGAGHTRLHTPFVGTLRLRAGYAIGRFLPYLTAGVAGTYAETMINGTNTLDVQAAPGVWVPVGSESASERTTGFAAGWTAGGGLEYAISGRWSGKADYLYTSLITSDLGDPPPSLHMLRAGLNYRF